MLRIFLVATVLFSGSGAVAQVVVGTSSIQIERSVSVSNIQPTVPVPVAVAGSGGGAAGGAPLSNAPPAAPAPPGAPQGGAVVQISGDPGRLYRISVPPPVTVDGQTPVPEVLTIWSDTSGDITDTQTGQLDANGQDTLRIGAVLAAGAAPPGEDEDPLTLNLDYE